MNIFSNVALDEDFKPFLHKYMNSIMIQIHFKNKCTELYRFVFNYFVSQKFEIKSRMDESLVINLQNLEETSPEIEKIEAELWLGMVHYGYQGSIPDRILKL